MAVSMMQIGEKQCLIVAIFSVNYYFSCKFTKNDLITHSFCLLIMLKQKRQHNHLYYLLVGKMFSSALEGGKIQPTTWLTAKLPLMETHSRFYLKNLSNY